MSAQYVEVGRGRGAVADERVGRGVLAHRRRGVIESSQAMGGCWGVRFADKSHIFRAADLKLLPTDAASFEPSQAPLTDKEKQASASESSKRGLSVAASTSLVRVYVQSL